MISSKNSYRKIQVRRDTSAEWTKYNPTLDVGEIGFEVDTKKFKIGDGTTEWNNLEFQGEGNLSEAIYDPQGIAGDVFNRANHTGTQPASTISNFDNEVTNNSDVVANTIHRHTTIGNPHNVTKTDVGLGNVENIAPIFTSDGSVIQESPISGNYDQDFLIGEKSELGSFETSNILFFDKSKGAFRAGCTANTKWNDENRGVKSFATGHNTIASGETSTALGYATFASGLRSTAIGAYSTAEDDYTVSIGFQNTTAGDGAITIGNYSKAYNLFSMAIGAGSEAKADYSMALGLYSETKGQESFAFGRYTTTNSYAETVIGSCNTDYTPASTTTWDANDRLFVVGNGVDSSNKSDALTVYKNGQILVGNSYSAPTADNEIATKKYVDDNAGSFTTTGGLISESANSDQYNSDFVIGSPQLTDDGNTNHDKRMFFDKSKGAFRAGRATGTEWDDANVGNYSIAFGSNCIAKGLSMAIGDGSKALEDYCFAGGYHSEARDAEAAFAFGSSCVATGGCAVALGNSTTASGDYSTALGHSTTASGNSSTALGSACLASGYSSVALGESNTASGTSSFTAGETNTASGYTSIALGANCVASGSGSFAAGDGSEASEYVSIALGKNTTASSDYSTALGYSTTASGEGSTASGSGTTAKSYRETVIGSYNTDTTPISTGSWNAADRLFVIGNGADSSNKSDALIIMKGGIQEYADNTAAKAAGLANGTVYRTGDIMKIVH